jgi:hypothetical protein
LSEASNSILADANSQSKKIKIIRYIGIVATLGISLVYLVLFYTQALSESSIYELLNTYYSPIISGIALILIFFRAYTSPKGANSRKAYWGFTLAVMFYFIAESLFVLQTFGLSSEELKDFPYPSISDLFWAIGTVLIIDEFFFIVKVITVKFSKKQLLAIYGLTALSIVGIVLFVFGDVIRASYDESYTPFAKAMDLYYFTGDVLILFATIYVVFGLFAKTGIKIFSLKHLAWIFLVLGNISMVFGDAFYAYFSWKGESLVLDFGFFTINFITGSYSIDNLLYTFQYMFWALSFAFFPPYLNRSFKSDTQTVDEEFIQIDTQKNLDFEVPSVSEALSETVIIAPNPLTFSQPEGVKNQNSMEES